MSLPFLFFALSINPWIWRIFLFKPLLGVILAFFSLILYKSFFTTRRKYFLLLAIIFPILLFGQWKLTPKMSLTQLSNDDRRVVDMRLREYPPVYIKLGSKVVFIPAAHWLEQRKESIALYRIGENLFEALDINQYFFATHPRERVGVKEFEKLPYILLLPFIFGVIRLNTGKNYRYFLLLLIISFFLLALIGSKGSLGPFILLPFIIFPIAIGLDVIYQRVKEKRILAIFLLVIFFLILIQTISYGIS